MPTTTRVSEHRENRLSHQICESEIEMQIPEGTEVECMDCGRIARGKDFQQIWCTPEKKDHYGEHECVNDDFYCFIPVDYDHRTPDNYVVFVVAWPGARAGVPAPAGQ